MTNDEALGIDELKMYFGRDYQVSDKITLHTPTVGEIIDFGERKYFYAIHSLTCIPSDMKSELFDKGIDYETISDYELFLYLIQSLTPEYTGLLFGDIDFSVMRRYKDVENDEICLCDLDREIKIDKLVYTKISTYLRKMHDIHPKIEHAYNQTTKDILIQLDREKIEKAKNTPYKSPLKPMISAMMRYPGFKYKSSELAECSIYELMDTVIGSQIYVSSTALIQGSYSGMIDTSKIPKKEFNWMRSADD